jgi:predicted transcriptional regulator
LELLGAIFEHEPESVREAAGLVDRDYKHVHRNLSELEDIDVIELEDGGTGQTKKPLLAYGVAEGGFSFGNSNGNVDTAAP